MATKGYLTGEDGEKSSMRLIWAFISIVIVSVWAIICIHNWAIAPLGYDLMSLIVLMSGTKVAQKMVEGGEFSLKIGEKGLKDGENRLQLVEKKLQATIDRDSSICENTIKPIKPPEA